MGGYCIYDLQYIKYSKLKFKKRVWKNFKHGDNSVLTKSALWDFDFQISLRNQNYFSNWFIIFDTTKINFLPDVYKEMWWQTCNDFCQTCRNNRRPGFESDIRKNICSAMCYTIHMLAYTVQEVCKQIFQQNKCNCLVKLAKQFRVCESSALHHA